MMSSSQWRSITRISLSRRHVTVKGSHTSASTAGNWSRMWGLPKPLLSSEMSLGCSEEEQSQRLGRRWRTASQGYCKSLGRFCNAVVQGSKNIMVLKQQGTQAAKDSQDSTDRKGRIRTAQNPKTHRTQNSWEGWYLPTYLYHLLADYEQVHSQNQEHADGGKERLWEADVP